MTSQRIFITGGASGLGRAIALRYARAGWNVCIGDVDATRGAQVLAELRQYGGDALFLPCDVTQEEALQRVADELEARWGGVDVVVNNAGVAQAGAIEDVTLADWQWILEINLLGVVRGCKVFTPLFKRQGHGHFVNTASMAGLLDVPLMGSYNASKAAVVSLSETLQNEFADDNIGVTVVCPAFFRTNLGQSLRSTVPGMDKTLDKLMTRTTVTAEGIADQIFEAVAKRRFHVLPHAEARRVWLLKRLLPRAWYAAMMQRHARRLKRKQEHR